MTRDEIEQQYQIKYLPQSNGTKYAVIDSPGKFEGQPIYMPYFWDIYLDGMAAEEDWTVDGYSVLSVEVLDSDIKAFPELKIDNLDIIMFYQDDQECVRRCSEKDRR